MKKVLIVVLVIIVLFGVIYFIGSGFTVRNDAVLCDFSVNEDGRGMTLYIGVTSSAGYVRAVKEISDEDEKRILRFYSAFGGINGDILKRSSFDISLSEETKEIYFYSENEPRLVLFKNEETGQWQRV